MRSDTWLAYGASNLSSTFNDPWFPWQSVEIKDSEHVPELEDQYEIHITEEEESVARLARDPDSVASHDGEAIVSLLEMRARETFRQLTLRSGPIVAFAPRAQRDLMEERFVDIVTHRKDRRSDYIEPNGGERHQRHWSSSDLRTAFLEAVQKDQKLLLKRKISGEPLKLAGRGSYVVIEPPPDAAFTVASGRCTVDTDGCVQSPGFPSNHANRESCVVRVNKSATGPIRQKHFSTEPGHDFLTVNRQRYSGSEGPDGVHPTEDIVWVSDHSGVSSGWKLCPTPVIDESDARLQADQSKDTGAQWNEFLASLNKFNVTEGRCVKQQWGPFGSGCLLSPGFKEGKPYNGSDRCVIKVAEGNDLPLRVLDFSTEPGLDVLSVNGKNYSGSDKPSGVVPTGEIIWSTDGAVERGGWKICLHKTDPVPLGPPTQSMFGIGAGPCVIDEQGCVEGDHNTAVMDQAACSINVNKDFAKPIEVRFFVTEAEYDVLVVNGIRYSGATSPRGIVPYEDIVWFSDNITTSTGFRICPTDSQGQIEQSMIGTMQESKGKLTIANGPCTIDSDGCALSQNYPESYGTSESCMIDVAGDNMLPIRMEDFFVEARFDTLTVNGKEYSGVRGPDGIIPNGHVHWSSDGSVAEGGWKLCLPSQVVPNPRDFVDLKRKRQTQIRKFAMKLSVNLAFFDVKLDKTMQQHREFKRGLLSIVDDANLTAVEKLSKFESLTIMALGSFMKNWVGNANDLKSAIEFIQKYTEVYHVTGLVQESTTKSLTKPLEDALMNTTSYLMWFYAESQESIKGIASHTKDSVVPEALKWLVSGMLEAEDEVDALAQALVDVVAEIADIVDSLALDSYGASPVMRVSDPEVHSTYAGLTQLAQKLSWKLHSSTNIPTLAIVQASNKIIKDLQLAQVA